MNKATELKLKNIILNWKNFKDFLLEKNNFYKKYKIEKKNSYKRRIICDPVFELKCIQRKILNILSEEIKFEKYVTGFVSGQSVKKNSQKHVGKQIVLNMDIHNFFFSTKHDKISENLSRFIKDKKLIYDICDICTLDGGLPQGSPLSPFIANICFHEADEKLNSLAKNNEGTYSRYADDITISSSDKGINDLIRYIECIVVDSGYRINKNKTRFNRRGERQSVTGVVVNSRPQPSRRYRYNLKAEFYNLSKEEGPIDFHVYKKALGKMHWVKQFNSRFSKKYLEPKLEIIKTKMKGAA